MGNKRNGSADEPTPISVPGGNVDHGLGEFVDQFEKPRRVGEMTVPEVAELKARNKTLAKLSEDIEHLARVRALVQNEKVSFIRSVGQRVGLTHRDELSVDDESGAINHVATRRFVQPSEATVTEAPIEGPGPDDDIAAPVN